MKKNKTKKVNYRVWRAISTTKILFGTAVKEKTKKGWLMIKVNWELPHEDYVIDKWQRASDLSREKVVFPKWF